MTRANGSFDFFSKEFVVGMAFSVDRTYLAGQLASGEGVTLVCYRQYLVCMSELYVTHIGGQYRRWRRILKFGNVEGRIEKVCGIELVESWASLSRRLSWLL